MIHDNRTTANNTIQERAITTSDDILLHTLSNYGNGCVTVEMVDSDGRLFLAGRELVQLLNGNALRLIRFGDNQYWYVSQVNHDD